MKAIVDRTKINIFCDWTSFYKLLKNVKYEYVNSNLYYDLQVKLYHSIYNNIFLARRQLTRRMENNKPLDIL